MGGGPDFWGLVLAAGHGGAVDPADLDRALSWMHRPDRVRGLVEAGPLPPPGLLAHLLRGWWEDAASPAVHGVGRLVALFRRAGSVADADDLPPPAEPLAVFRGEGAGGAGFGVSWTTEAAAAAWFARRVAFRGPGTLWAAEAPPAAVLGRFAGRGEATVVVDPWRLRRRRLVRRAASDEEIPRPGDGALR